MKIKESSDDAYIKYEKDGDNKISGTGYLDEMREHIEILFKT